MYWLKKLIKDEKGYGTIELLILISASLVIAFAVYKGLSPTLIELDGKAVESIGKVSGSGY